MRRGNRFTHPPAGRRKSWGTVNGEPGSIRTLVCRDAYSRWVVDPDRQVGTPKVIYREPTTAYYRNPVPFFLNLNLGWGFNGGHNHGFSRPDLHGWRDGNHEGRRSPAPLMRAANPLWQHRGLSLAKSMLTFFSLFL